MKFPFQRYNMIDIIANDLKPMNDKTKIINHFCMQISCFCICYKEFQDCFAVAKELNDDDTEAELNTS